MDDDTRTVDDALIRRIDAAIGSAGVSREAVEFDWPQCHRKNCPHRHGRPDAAFMTMKIQIMDAVRSELRWETTTRPDVADDNDSPEEAAAVTLAVLLGRYNVHDAGTYIKAAQLIVEAYPGLVPVLAGEAS